MSENETVVRPFADLVEPAVVTTVDGTPKLIGARCRNCAAAWFPTRPVCPSCASADPEPYLIGPEGRLYSYSIVHVSSSRPTPYTLGYVDLDEGVRVLATIESAGLELDAARCELQLSDGGGFSFRMAQL